MTQKNKVLGQKGSMKRGGGPSLGLGKKKMVWIKRKESNPQSNRWNGSMEQGPMTLKDLDKRSNGSGFGGLMTQTASFKSR